MKVSFTAQLGGKKAAFDTAQAEIKISSYLEHKLRIFSLALFYTLALLYLYFKSYSGRVNI
jgi:hypothetical protein